MKPNETREWIDHMANIRESIAECRADPIVVNADPEKKAELNKIFDDALDMCLNLSAACGDTKEFAEEMMKAYLVMLRVAAALKWWHAEKLKEQQS